MSRSALLGVPARGPSPLVLRQSVIRSLGYTGIAPARQRASGADRTQHVALPSVVGMCSVGSLPCPHTTRPGRGYEEIHWRGPRPNNVKLGPTRRRVRGGGTFQSPHEDTRGRSRHAGRNASKGALLLSGSSASLAEEIEGGQPTGCPPSKLIYDRNSLRVSHNERLPTPSDRDVVQHDVARAHVIAVLHYDID